MKVILHVSLYTLHITGGKKGGLGREQSLSYVGGVIYHHAAIINPSSGFSGLFLCRLCVCAVDTQAIGESQIVHTHTFVHKRMEDHSRNSTITTDATLSQIHVQRLKNQEAFTRLVTAENVERFERVCREMQRIMAMSSRGDGGTPMKSCTTVVIPRELLPSHLDSVVSQVVRKTTPSDPLSVIVAHARPQQRDMQHANGSLNDIEQNATTQQQRPGLSVSSSSSSSTTSCTALHTTHQQHEPPQQQHRDHNHDNSQSVIVVYRSPATVTLDKFANRSVTMRECSLPLWSLYNALCIKATRKAISRSIRRRCATPTSRIKSMNNFIKTILLGKYNKYLRHHGRPSMDASGGGGGGSSNNNNKSISSHSGSRICTATTHAIGGLNVLDLGCGRGQDVYKVEHIQPSKVLFIDLADQCLRLAERRWRRNESPYQASFVQADFTVPDFLDRANIMYYKHVYTGSCGVTGDVTRCAHINNTPSKYGRDNDNNTVTTEKRCTESRQQEHRPRGPSSTTTTTHSVRSVGKPRTGPSNTSSAPAQAPSTAATHCKRTHIGITTAAHVTIPGPSPMFDLITCQFAAQYAADSVETLNTFLGNVVRYMAPGGIFLGIVPDAARVAALLHQHHGTWTGPHCTMSLQRPDNLQQLHPPVLAPTGICYKFSMDDTIRCYEYTLNFNDFVTSAKRHGLRLLQSDNAAQFARREMADPMNRSALRHMGLTRHLLSREEWDTVAMYRIFAFVKDDDESHS